VASYALRDGGRVETGTYQDANGATWWTAQKYDAAGAPVGNLFQTISNVEPTVDALPGGEYVVDFRFSDPEGGHLRGYVFNAAAQEVNTVNGNGSGIQLVPSVDDGFVVLHRDTSKFLVGDYHVDLFGQDARPISTAAFHPDFDTTVTVTPQAGGDYQLTWTNQGFDHTLMIDQAHLDFTPPQSPDPTVFDDNPPPAQPAPVGSNDATPIVRIPVTETGWYAVEVETHGAPRGYAGTDHPITAEDVARGYIDVTLGPLSDGSYDVRVQVADANNIAAADHVFQYLIDTTAPATPTIQTLIDDAGAQTGPVAAGGTTDDTTPTVRVSLQALGPDQENAQVMLDGKAYGVAPISASDVANGYIDVHSVGVTVTPGQHTFTASIYDRAGNVSGTSAGYSFTEAAAAGQVIHSPGPGSSVTGGTGDDTIYASRGSDTITGGAGADVFVWSQEPWSPATVTDFQVGTDRLDLSALFAASGYSGTDPVADGYIRLQNGPGGLQVLFDRDGPAPGQQWPNFIITLNGLNAFSTTWAELSGQAPAPAPGPTVDFAGPNYTVTLAEGQTTNPGFNFAINRSGDLSQQATVDWAVTGSGDHPADGADFTGGVLPHGTATFAAGVGHAIIHVPVADDSTVENDETFALTLSNPSGVALGANAMAHGVITNDDTAPSNGGQVINSPGPGSTLTGGAGDDTINASQGPDVITGGAGADVFHWDREPWAPARITDFQLGTDRIDFSALFAAAGYTGSNPVADHYIQFLDDGAGGTKVVFDHDGPGPSPQWGNYVLQLEHVSSQGLTWAQLTGAPPPPPGAQGQITVPSGPYDAAEGNSGLTRFGVGIQRFGDVSGSASVDWSIVAGPGTSASPSDFEGGVFPTGHVTFAPGQDFIPVNWNVVGDTTAEPNETFRLVLTNVQGATLGNSTANFTIDNDDAASPPPPSGGQVINSPGPNSTLTGGAGDDTLNASRGSDVLTGGGGHDVFAWAQEPWSPAEVTDFTPGVDKLDLHAIFDTIGFTGADPFAAGYMSLISDGADGTKVLLDHDAGGPSPQWPNYIIHIQHVAPSAISMSDWIFQ
jgi:Ca2+-binding RTX toxin-like protein